jgi:hypothetical protein
MILKRFLSVSGNWYTRRYHSEGSDPKIEVATEQGSHVFDEGKAVP